MNKNKNKNPLPGWNLKSRRSEGHGGAAQDSSNKPNSVHESVLTTSTLPRPLFRHSMKALTASQASKLQSLGTGPISRVL